MAVAESRLDRAMCRSRNAFSASRVVGASGSAVSALAAVHQRSDAPPPAPDVPAPAWRQLHQVRGRARRRGGAPRPRTRNSWRSRPRGPPRALTRSHAGLQTLDAVDLAATLRKRVLTLQSVPMQVRSTLRTGFRAGLQLVADESSAESTLRGRHRPRAPRRVAPAKKGFPNGAQWFDRLAEAASAAQQQTHTHGRATTTQGTRRTTYIRRRAERAAALACLPQG